MKIQSPALRTVFAVILLAVIAPAIYRSYGIFRADRIARTDKTVEGYTRAIGLDPSNATLWYLRGRLRHYAVQNANLALAVRDYRQALALNPRLGDAWADLAGCYNQLGRYAEAESAFEKSFEVRRYSPLIRWQAGNFYLRRGNLPKMYECFKMASEFDNQKLGIAMDVAWKIDPDHAEILQKLVPDTLNANLRYLQFLVAHDALDLAAPAWRRFMKNDIPAETELKPSSAFGFIDHLLARARVDEALTVWNDILRKTRSGLSDNRLAATASGGSGGKPENLMWNGSFENEILRGGFDWRYPDSPTIQFHIDTANRMEGLKSLRLDFQGENLSYPILYQFVPILEPGTHQLDFCLRTKGLTTDQTPFVIIQGYTDAAGAAARSEFFPATAEWSKISLPFTVQPGCKAVRVVLLRNKSSKFDNEIKGTLWLDGFQIRRIGG